MKLTIFVLSMLCAFYCIGQNITTSDEKYTAIKVYNTSSSHQHIGYSYSMFGNDTIPVQKNYQDFIFFHPSVAFTWKRKKHISHEIELSNFVFQVVDTTTRRLTPQVNTLNGNLQVSMYIAVRYEYMYNIFSFPRRFSPSISAAITPYFQYQNTHPHTSLNYPTSFRAIGGKLSIIPRLNIKLTKRCFLDVNLPIMLFDQSIQRVILKNPSLPLNQQRNSYGNSAFFSGIGDISARIGVGIKL